MSIIMKTCPKCHSTKPVTHFGMYKGMTKYHTTCSECRAEYTYSRRRNKSTIIDNFASQIKSKGGNRISTDGLTIEINELGFDRLYEEWFLNGHPKALKPCIRQIDVNKDYLLGNIHLTTKERLNNRNRGNVSKNDRVVLQISKDINEVMAEYHNPSEASKATGIDLSSISRALRGIRGSAGGYTWKYKDEGGE